VTQFAHLGSDQNSTRYSMTLESYFGLLSRTNDCRIFQGVSALDVIKTLLREHAVPFSESLNESYRTWEYLVQYRESTFNFISRLMEQEGIYYYFKHEETNHTMVLADPLSTLDALPGYEEIAFVPAEEHDRGDRDHLDSWRESWQVLSGAVTSRDFDFKKPKSDLTVRAQAPALDHPHNDMEVYDPPGEYLTNADGEKGAQVLQLAAEGDPSMDAESAERRKLVLAAYRPPGSGRPRSAPRPAPSRSGPAVFRPTRT